MSKFVEIMKSGKYHELSECAKSNNLLITEGINDEFHAYIFSAKKENSDMIINGAIYEDHIDVVMTDEAGGTLESFSRKYESDESLMDILKTSFDTYSTLESVGLSDNSENEIVKEENEEFTSIPAGLATLKDKAKSLADDLKDLSSRTQDVEMIAIIMDLANTAYTLALNIDDANESYDEINGIEEDSEETQDESIKVDEIQARIKIAESVIAMRDLVKSDVVTKENCTKYEQLIKDIIL